MGRQWRSHLGYLPQEAYRLRRRGRTQAAAALLADVVPDVPAASRATPPHGWLDHLPPSLAGAVMKRPCSQRFIKSPVQCRVPPTAGNGHRQEKDPGPKQFQVPGATRLTFTSKPSRARAVRATTSRSSRSASPTTRTSRSPGTGPTWPFVACRPRTVDEGLLDIGHLGEELSQHGHRTIGRHEEIAQRAKLPMAGIGRNTTHVPDPSFS